MTNLLKLFCHPFPRREKSNINYSGLSWKAEQSVWFSDSFASQGRRETHRKPDIRSELSPSTSFSLPSVSLPFIAEKYFWNCEAFEQGLRTQERQPLLSYLAIQLKRPSGQSVQKSTPRLSRFLPSGEGERLRSFGAARAVHFTSHSEKFCTS